MQNNSRKTLLRALAAAIGFSAALTTAAASAADPLKVVETLGAFHLPVEVVPFGLETTRVHIQRLLDGQALSQRPMLVRQRDGAAFRTDEGNLILDLSLECIPDPAALARGLNEKVALDDYITDEFFDAVAQVLFWAESVKEGRDDVAAPSDLGDLEEAEPVVPSGPDIVPLIHGLSGTTQQGEEYDEPVR